VETLFKHDRKLNKDTGGKDFDYTWDYRNVIGKMNYLEKSTRGDLAISVHQCAWYMLQLMGSHGEVIKCIGKYQLGTWDKGFIVRRDMHKSFECYVDAHYCGNWTQHIQKIPTQPRIKQGI
jgi:hypothetical protein